MFVYNLFHLPMIAPLGYKETAQTLVKVRAVLQSLGVFSRLLDFSGNNVLLKLKMKHFFSVI